MSWSFAAGPGVLILALIIWIGAGFISFLNWKRSGRRRAVGRLEALRFLLITCLTLTLLRPEMVQTISAREQPEVAILLDRSDSMATRDIQRGSNLLSRASWLSNQVAAKFWEPLGRNTKVVVEDFGETTTNSSSVAGTDLNAALEQPLEREGNLKAVMILTDGDWNQGKTPLSAAAQFRDRNIPVFALGVGSERHVPDLNLETVSPPSYGLFGEQITIPFVIRSHLTNEVTTTITLTDGTREETRKEVVVPAGGQLQDALLWYPRNVGDVTLQLSIPVQPGEALPENNEQSFRISVRVEKLKVLVVDSLPRWEYRYLRNALARDPGVDLHSILYHPGIGMGGGRDYLPSFPSGKESIAQYDVIFLGDIGIGEGELTNEDAELIKGLVEQQGSGLVFVPGRRGRQLSLANSALKDLLPVTFDESKPAGQPLQNEAVLTLTAAGKSHLLTRFETDDDLNAQLWQSLPGFFWSAPVEKSRPGTDVIGVHSTLRNASGRLPLLATRSAGNGKVLFLGTDSAWRWRRGVEDKYHYRFWSQVVRWMAHQRHLAGKEGIRLAYSPERPKPNDTIFLQTTVLNSAGFPAEEGNVVASITAPDGRSEHIQFNSLEGGWGVFTSSFTPVQAGSYKLAIESPQHNRRLESELIVQQPVLEEKGRPINRSILAEVAGITGGRFGSIEELGAILEQISLTPEPKPLQKRFRIWSSPYWGGFILLLLTVYWIGRKVAGML